MRKIIHFVIAGAVVALVLVAITYLATSGRTPSEKVEVPGRGTADVTPVDKMRVRTAEGQPEIDPATFSLSVGGLVSEPFTLSLDEINALPADEEFVELPCVEGWTEAGVWKGPRLAALLERAGVADEAETVVFSSPNGYTTSLTVADVEETDPILAYAVNGERLPEEQGYPLRLVVPDRLGYKWIKWVTGIELVKGPYEGYWESRGYSNDAGTGGR